MVRHGKPYGVIVTVFVSLVALALPGSGQAQEQEITGKDGAPMMLVPAGDFTMGSKEGVDEQPVHRVSLDAYYMDKYEVTVGQYAKFLEAKFLEATSPGVPKPETPPYWDVMNASLAQKRPVAHVNWTGADGYCRWAGKRLPTEAEWEKAARGTDGRMYPWGNEPPTELLANFGKKDWSNHKVTVPAGLLKDGKSPYGIYDLAGNVYEWVSDWYDKDYYKNSPSKNPKGPERGEDKVVRGGSWNSPLEHLRSTIRFGYTPAFSRDILGFRCAKTP
jgi:formylglycine-generating enzyme required for sulfatase activity